MKTERGIIDVFLSIFTIFYKVNPRFRGKQTKCVAALAQNNCVYPNSPSSTKQIHMFEENRPILLLLWPKAHVCMVVD